MFAIQRAFSREAGRRPLHGVRQMSSGGNKSMQNGLLAGVLLGFVGLVYYTSMSKMKQGDELGSLIENERVGKDDKNEK
jgi:hypothetical protein